MGPTPHIEARWKAHVESVRSFNRDPLADARAGPSDERVPETDHLFPPEKDQSWVRVNGAAVEARPCPPKRHARPSAPCFRQSEWRTHTVVTSASLSSSETTQTAHFANPT